MRQREKRRLQPPFRREAASRPGLLAPASCDGRAAHPFFSPLAGPLCGPARGEKKGGGGRMPPSARPIRPGLDAACAAVKALKGLQRQVPA
jgi:hypothetical protein